MKPLIHPTAILETGVIVGDDSSIWDNVHIRRNTVIGAHCIVGEKSHISYDVRIGNLVKINAFVYICTAITIETGVMISAGTIFTNDRYPRAADPDLVQALDSAPNENTLPTLVRQGTTVGAGSIIGPGIILGQFSMIGMGSVVTRSVPDFHLVFGNPARFAGYVCRCGEPLPGKSKQEETVSLGCLVCGRGYRVEAGQVSEAGKLELQAS